MAALTLAEALARLSNKRLDGRRCGGCGAEVCAGDRVEQAEVLFAGKLRYPSS